MSIKNGEVYYIWLTSKCIPMKRPLLVPCLFAVAAIATSCSQQVIQNEFVKLDLRSPNEIHLTDKMSDKTTDFTGSAFSFVIDGREYRSENLPEPKISVTSESLTFYYPDSLYPVKVLYELKPGWKFFSRQLLIESRSGKAFKINKISQIRVRCENNVKERFKLTGGKYGLSLRFAEPSPQAEKAAGCFVLVQNPFTLYDGEGQNLDISYEPEMNWNPADGPFPSDRLCIGMYELSGTTFRQDMAAEWVYEVNPDEFLTGGQQVDLAEIEAVMGCTTAFLGVHPEKSARVHVGWCENDYQINMAIPEHRVEYKRIIDQAAAVGCDYVLYTPDHSKLTSLDQNADAWGWESLLFLNMGQKIRTGEWMPKRDPIPADIQDILDYAKSKNMKLLAYAYPSLPFMQNPEWTAWRTKIGEKPGGYTTVDTGLRSFQDWWVDLLVDFYEYTGIGGYSFDHWWTAYTDDAGLVSSKYQQWFGVRRILDELRLKAPDMIVDTRQQVHHFGTWTWLAGTYPHPMMSDEQPGSFNAIPDLSTDRVSAARQRFVAWRLMTRDYTPIEVLPGFITHQTQRDDANRVMRRDHYRTRDWDFFGWKYNLISSVATAPFNHVVNYLPARDEQEFNAFSESDRQFFRKWMDFTDQNLEVLKHTRPIIGQPMVGRCDGTSAIVDNQGFIFVFNPNYRSMVAGFRLDPSIGLNKPGKYRLTELYPDEGLIVGDPEKGDYSFGDEVSMRMKGTTARVLRIEPVRDGEDAAVLYNCLGKIVRNSEEIVRNSEEVVRNGEEVVRNGEEVVRNGEVLEIKEARGLMGEEYRIVIKLLSDRVIKRLVVNGKETAFTVEGDLVKAVIRFEGEAFGAVQEIGRYDPKFAGGEVNESLTIPQRIFDQLEKRKKSWPVSYTDDDLVAPWAGPSRLLLYVQIAEPYRDTVITWSDGKNLHHDNRKAPIRATDLRLEIDGKKADLREAYNGVYPFVERTNLGYFVDISGLTPDVEHKLHLVLPKGLKPGQYQGIFVEHVEGEMTEQLR